MEVQVIEWRFGKGSVRSGGEDSYLRSPWNAF